MGVVDNFKRAVLDWLLSAEMPASERARLAELVNMRSYAVGDHRRQLRVKPGGGDDNITVNWLGLVVARSIAMLYGDGVQFQIGADTADTSSSDDARDAEAPEVSFIEEVWTANKQAITLYKLAQFGGIYGTVYAKIAPGGLTYRGRELPRIVALNPLWMTIDTEPEDFEQVRRYIAQYAFTAGDKTYERREVTERQENGTWLIMRQLRGKQGVSQGWAQDGEPVEWPYTFSPVIHWQNLPDAESVYGRGDFWDAVEPQDRYNFVAANTSKIIRNHAHPKTFGRMLGNAAEATWGADQMITSDSPDADVKNLEMQSDLASSRAFALDLRQSIFDMCQTIDTSSIADKIGALTNFGLRVLFKDALERNNVKRSLYGDGLSELNRRMLVIGGIAGEDEADGGVVIWPDPLPTNAAEMAQAVTADLSAGIVSKQTASTERGYKWEDEQARMSEEQAAQQSLGVLALRDFLNQTPAGV